MGGGRKSQAGTCALARPLPSRRGEPSAWLTARCQRCVWWAREEWAVGLVVLCPPGLIHQALLLSNGNLKEVSLLHGKDIFSTPPNCCCFSEGEPLSIKSCPRTPQFLSLSLLPLGFGFRYCPVLVTVLLLTTCPYLKVLGQDA